MSFINQIDPKKLFDFARIFESTPNPQGLYQYTAFVFGLLIVAAIILIFVSRNKKKILKDFFNKLANLFLFTGVAGLILIFCRWQGIPYLGSRLLLYLMFFVFIIWGGFLVWHRIFTWPKEIKKIEEKERFEKYLPHYAAVNKKSKGK